MRAVMNDIGCENGYVANNICSPKENDCNTCFNTSITSFSHSFIRLVDYLVTSTFHQMVVKAVAHMLSVLQQQRCQSQSRSPSDPAEVSRTAGHAEIAVDHTHTRSQFEQLFNFAWCFSLSPSWQKPQVIHQCSPLSSFWTQKH